MKQLMGLIALLLLVGGGCSTYQVFKNNQPIKPVATRDITVEDISNFFNKHPDYNCAKLIKGFPDSPNCFSKDFKSLHPEPEYIFSDPGYELVDFNSDGNLDAYVTIYLNGTGHYKIFYVFTKNNTGDLIEVYKLDGYEGGIGLSDSEVSLVTYSAEKGYESLYLKWNKEKNTFDQIDAPKTSK